jgi:SAM-dependent methyltransferase
VAHTWHPEIRDRVKVHDLRKPLPFKSAFFDFVMCNAVIQHINPDDVHKVVLPELVRVLQPKGVLELMFKNGKGTITVYDKDFCTHRCFQLFEENEILKTLNKCGMELIKAEGKELGGVMWFVDPKSIRHCVMFLRKTGANKDVVRTNK